LLIGGGRSPLASRYVRPALQQLRRQYLWNRGNRRRMKIIGAKNWPTSIPLVNTNNSWYFDTEAGAKEILFRRIGRNEISAIRVCQELVAAEKEYRSSQHDEYARKIFSDEGRHNGLYWKVADGEPQSPIGPLVASAVAEGYAKRQAGPPTPYRGYYFHILTKQGKVAPAARNLTSSTAR
jgi:Protein of unknown function (DUF2950)